MLPTQPVKMMRYRGADDAAVGYGHFAETRRLQTGPDDVVVPYKGDANEEVGTVFTSFPSRFPLFPVLHALSHLRPSPLYTPHPCRTSTSTRRKRWARKGSGGGKATAPTPGRSRTVRLPAHAHGHATL